MIYLRASLWSQILSPGIQYSVFLLVFRKTGKFWSQFFSRPPAAIFQPEGTSRVDLWRQTVQFSPPQAKIFSIFTLTNKLSFYFHRYFWKSWKIFEIFPITGRENFPKSGKFENFPVLNRKKKHWRGIYTLVETEPFLPARPVMESIGLITVGFRG